MTVRGPGGAAVLGSCFTLRLLAAAHAAPPPPKLPAVLTLDDALRIFREHGLDLIIAEATGR
jgi:hypothetical protein